jgi:hypothetical protein
VSCLIFLTRHEFFITYKSSTTFYPPRTHTLLLDLQCLPILVHKLTDTCKKNILNAV